MKAVFIIAGIFALIIVSCKKENIEVKKVNHEKMMGEAKSGKLNVAIVNEEDLVCGMKTAEFLKDTANYKGKTYGFCNSMCKEEFKKAPEKYIENENKKE